MPEHLHNVESDKFLNTLTDEEIAKYVKDVEADAYLFSIECHEDWLID